MKDKIIFDFQNPVKVQFKDGEKNSFLDLDKIYLSAPSYKDKDKTLVLKKKFIENSSLLNNFAAQAAFIKKIAAGRNEVH